MSPTAFFRFVLWGLVLNGPRVNAIGDRACKQQIQAFQTSGVYAQSSVSAVKVTSSVSGTTSARKGVTAWLPKPAT